jgi:hypothetical protein
MHMTRILNLCRPCGLDFASVAAFDRHRVGDHELDHPEHENGRRCLTVDEMPTKGMELDPRGRWRIALSVGTRERLQALKGSTESDRELDCEEMAA